MKTLSGIKVLLIAPVYHKYISIIASAFESLGANVESFTEEPTSIFCTNFYLSRIWKFSFMKGLYYRQVISRNKNILNSLKWDKYDHIVIIKGDLLTEEFILKLKNLMPTSNLVMYQWDSIESYNYLHRLKYFNAVFSFDYADCKKYDQINYLPLFYSDEFEQIASIKDINYEFDLFFLGINHSIRVIKLLEMIDFCEENELYYSFNLKTSITEKIKLVLKSKKKINCFFQPLKYDDFSDKYIKSKAIVDITDPNQTGLPIRIIEAVGANKKIITTNYNVVNEDFYDPKMIFIWGKDNPEKLVHFLNQKHEKKDFEKYSVKSFVLKLISSGSKLSQLIENI
jgi:hypothetical protein